MTYREFFDHAGSEYTAGERFGLKTKNRVPVDPVTGFTYKGALPEERIHRAVISKAISDGKGIPASVLADYPDLAVKESWQMTKEEYIAEAISKQPPLPKKPSAIQGPDESRMWFGLAYEHIVGRAIAEGKPVPAHVLAEYKELSSSRNAMFGGRSDGQ